MDSSFRVGEGWENTFRVLSQSSSAATGKHEKSWKGGLFGEVSAKGRSRNSLFWQYRVEKRAFGLARAMRRKCRRRIVTCVRIRGEGRPQEGLSGCGAEGVENLDGDGRAAFLF